MTNKRLGGTIYLVEIDNLGNYVRSICLFNNNGRFVIGLNCMVLHMFFESKEPYTVKRLGGDEFVKPTVNLMLKLSILLRKYGYRVNLKSLLQ